MNHLLLLLSAVGLPIPLSWWTSSCLWVCPLESSNPMFLCFDDWTDHDKESVARNGRVRYYMLELVGWGNPSESPAREGL